jgi:hypothetical protein
VLDRVAPGSQQRHLFAIINLLHVLRWCAADAHRAAAGRVSAALAQELDALFDEWRAGIPLTSSLPKPDELEADPMLQAAQAEAEDRIAKLLEVVTSTTPPRVQ